MSTITIQRIKINEFSTFIKKLLPIDRFIYLKINTSNIVSCCYLPERDAVKLQSIPVGEIFESDSLPDKEFKMSFLNGQHTIEALRHFTGQQVSAEISYRELGTDLVACNLKLISDELTIDLPCADPSLGFQDMTSEQIKTVFSTDDNMFVFDVQPFHIEKLNSLFSLEKEHETFKVAIDQSGIKFKGETYDSLVTASEAATEAEVVLYKKYVGLLDKESYHVTICNHKAVWRSLDSETMLTIATCQA